MTRDEQEGQAAAFPPRQIHLDFHNSPDIPDVGADWDAERFARTLKAAQVESITLFAKCHHGMSYYPSAIGQIHPALTFDLLGEQIAACRRAGIRCPIYLSVVWDVSAAERHPEWRQVDVDGRQVKQGRGLFEPGWPWLCVNSPYADELAAQTEELIDRYECDGFFYDILMYHPDGCLCVNCLAELRRAGRDPRDPRERRLHNQEVARRFMARMSGLVRARLPRAGIFYNSRWGLQFEGERQYYSQIEIEALPTGGWGYGFYQLWSRYGRTFGLPMLGMTGRFHRSWADWGGLKHPDALRVECGGILATGGAISIGDQMHPRGRLNPAVYEVIGAAFADVAAVERYCTGATPVAQAAILVSEPDSDRAEIGASGGALEGAAKMLIELHHQFDVVTPRCPDFGAYELLVVPDAGAATPDLTARLAPFVAGGGRLLLSHEALLDRKRGNFAMADMLGVDYLGPSASVPDYFQIVDPALHGPVTRAGFAYSLYLGPSVRVAPRAGTQTLAEAYASYFDRTWEHFSSHDFTPPVARPAGYPAITRSASAIYVYGPIFAAYQQHGNLTFRALVGRCVDLLLPAPLLATDAPATAEVALTRQGQRQIVHVVNYHASRRAPGHVEALETPAPLRDVTLRLRRPWPTGRVFLAHDGAEIPFAARAGVVTATVPRVDAHAMVVFES